MPEYDSLSRDELIEQFEARDWLLTPATSTTKLIKNMTVTVERVDETTVFNPVEPE